MRTLLLLVFAAVAFAQPNNWTQLTNTAISSVCPPDNTGGSTYAYSTNCYQVVRAWSGATVDTKRNRLMLWGGGHVAYRGNEMYALELDSANLSTSYIARTNSTAPTMVRLTNPSAFDSLCAANADSTPMSEHSYGALVYLPKADKVFKWEGINYCGTSVDKAIYLFDPTTNTWSKPTITMPGSGDPVTSFGSFCALDPTTTNESVICYIANQDLVRWDSVTNVVTRLVSYGTQPIQTGATVVVDPDRKLLFSIGTSFDGDPANGKIYAIDLASPYALTDWTSSVSGCDDLKNYPYPAVSWDPSLNRIVGYVPRGSGTTTAANKIVIFDPATKQCVSQPIGAGPTAENGFVTIAGAQGIFNRFAYIPGLKKYVVVNNSAGDAYTFALNTTTANGLGATADLTSPTTRYTCLDRDGDGYGTGPGCTGADADDQDATVHTAAEACTKWGGGACNNTRMLSVMRHLGYDPTNIFYMSTTGTDASTGGTPNCKNSYSTPCATWAYIASSVADGDATLLFGGNYSFGAYPLGGSAGHIRVFASVPGELAIFNGSIGFSFDDQSYFAADGFRFTAVGSNGCVSANSTTHAIFRHIDASGCLWGLVANGDSAPYQAMVDFTIEDSVFHDSAGEHGIYLASHGGVINRDVFIRRNLLYKNLRTGMQANGRFSNMIQEQNITWHNTDGGGFAWENGVANSIFRNNLSINETNGGLVISTYDGYEGGDTAPPGSQVIGCGVAFDEVCSCLNLAQRGTICAYDQSGNLIENYTVYLSGTDYTGASAANKPAIQASRQGGCTQPICLATNNGGNTFRNLALVVNNSSDGFAPFRFGDSVSPIALASATFQDVVYKNGANTSVVTRGTGGASTPMNCATAASNSAGFTDCLNADPQFVAAATTYWSTPASFDLRPATGSPLIAAGTPGKSALDLVGSVRSMSAPTIGAYEYQGVIAPPCSLSGTLPAATVGSAYVGSLSAANCASSTYTQSGLGSSACSGLSLNGTTGAITGTPTTAGTCSFTGSYDTVIGQAFSIAVSSSPAGSARRFTGIFSGLIR